MTSSLPSFYALGRLAPRSKVHVALRTRAQGSANEGMSSISIVDANMGVLKEKMERLRMKERLQKQCRDGEGWYYQKQYDMNLKGNAKLSDALNVIELAFGTLGLTILSCTLCLCFVSLIAH